MKKLILGVAIAAFSCQLVITNQKRLQKPATVPRLF
jgi:hypothetical protein